MVIVYLFAIVAANLLVGWFGPSVTVINAFLFIGLDITSRDKLHDRWHGNGLVWKMGLLIAVGGIVSWILNNGLAQIAIASTVSFVAAAIIDTAVYHLARNKSWFARCNLSNLASGAADSILFPLLAFGWPPMLLVMLGQFVAKVLGGFVWSYILKNKKESNQP
jgi:hypothetical protein